MKKVLLFVMLFLFVSTAKVECIVGAKATAFLAGCVVGSSATIGALVYTVAQTMNEVEKKVYLERLQESLRKSEQNLRNILKTAKNQLN